MRPTDPPPTRSERLMRRMLRFGALATGHAVVGIFVPKHVMARYHWRLGLGHLGKFPDSPLTDYLTRSLSVMYAFHGAKLFALSRDVRRHRPVIRVVAWGSLAMGALVTGIDRKAPMPPWWTAIEGPSMGGVGLLLLAVERRMRREEAPEEVGAEPAPPPARRRPRRAGKGLLLVGGLAALGLRRYLRGTARRPEPRDAESAA